MNNTMRKKEVYLSLGSNKGDCFKMISQAIQMIASIENVTFIKNSYLYQTSPLSPYPQDDYLNAACLIKTTLFPLSLLNKLQTIERALGQETPYKEQKPRLIDIDILFYEGVELNEKNLTLPHPMWHKRLFVLIPLLDLTETIYLPNQFPFSLRTYLKNFPNKKHQRIVLYTKRRLYA